jgi:Zn-dependent peptidase ImmA (M78 family)
MNQMLRFKINSLAEDILKINNTIIPIKNMKEVVELLGGKVSEKEDLRSSSTGNIKKGNGNDIYFEILISKEQPSNKKNFTIAYQLGHLFLHMGYCINEDLWESFNNGQMLNVQDNPEAIKQANEFALAFLMPSMFYIDIFNKYSKNNRVSIDKVAEYFNVSIDTAFSRGQSLGYVLEDSL